jgi:uncharacterized protein with von Willebrand factor type A (vWA) domain
MHSIVHSSNIGQLSWTSNLDEGVEHLGKQIHRLLDYVQEPTFYENLESLTQTMKSLLNLVRNAAMFLEDCFSPRLNSELLTYCLSITGSPLRRRFYQSRLQNANYEGL